MKRRIVARTGASATPTLIFIHGLSSSPEGTWREMYGLCASDKLLAGFDLGFYGYPTALMRLPFTPKLADIQGLSDGLRTEIQNHHSNSDRVILVCHSLGGLVAKNFLLREAKLGRDVSKYELILFAVPNKGAAVAGLGKILSFAHMHLNQLTKNSELLRAMNEDWQNMGMRDRVRTVYITGGSDKVVSSGSSQAYVGNDATETLIEFNHSNITKAASREDNRYVVLRRFILRESDKTDCVTQDSIVEHELQPYSPPDPLFDIYSPQDRNFYLERTFDTGLAAFNLGHTWIWGKSGVGKTSALRRAGFSRGQIIQITLSSNRGASSLTMFQAIAQEMAEFVGHDCPPLSSLADMLKSIKRSIARLGGSDSFMILIEEIPYSSHTDCTEFVTNLLDLSLLLDGDASTKGRVVVACSSIFNPLASGGCSPKIHERIQFVNMVPWTEQEIRQLVDLLAAPVRPSLSKIDRDIIAARTQGSPRAAKMVFRRWRNRTDQSLSTQDLVDQVMQDQIV